MFAAIAEFSDVKNFVGVEINTAHLEKLYNRQKDEKLESSYISIINADFFTLDWSTVLDKLPEPIFIIGNPAWVTSAELGMLQSSNLPKKSNFQGRNGLDALTGKSNFDISEWMLLKHLEWLKQRSGVIGMLCKTAVARKVLIHAWKHRYPILSSRIYTIDAQKHFNASVDACFFIIEIGSQGETKNCDIFNNLTDVKPSHTIGNRDEIVVADISSYEKLRSLRGLDEAYTWRSGIKHDCAKVMELEQDGQSYKNGKGDVFCLEDTYIYPLLKSSDIANGRVYKCRKYVLVTQQFIGEDTSHIKIDAQETWNYLQKNAVTLANRSSSVYKKHPAFSIFGVGEYTFAPWKVAISGFYKSLKFQVVGLIDEKPAICDDTIYFLACHSEEEARFIAMLLNSPVAKEFFTSMIFWNDKRPITIELLKRLNIYSLACILAYEEKYLEYAENRLRKRKYFCNKVNV